MEEIAKFVSQVGFPIAVASYLLIRMERKLSNLQEAIDRLTRGIEKNFHQEKK